MSIYTNLTVGQVVGIMRTGSWDVHAEGKYRVTKVNKMRVTLVDVMGHNERVFSVKTGEELGLSYPSRRFIVSEDRIDTHNAMMMAAKARDAAARNIENAVKDLSKGYMTKERLATIRAALDAAELLCV